MNECKLSVIVPCFNEEIIIEQSISTIKTYCDKIDCSYEIIFVDDGSKDMTFSLIKNHALIDNRIRGIRFTRNFGKESAIYAGLGFSRGEAVVIIDADLQHPPSLLPTLYKHWSEEKYEIVEAVKSYNEAKNKLLYLKSSLFNRLMTKFTGFNMHGASDYKLLDRKVVTSLINLSEKNRLFRGLSTWTGYKTKQVFFEVGNRIGGKTKWSFFSLFNLSVSAITSFSNIPLQLITTLGAITLIMSFVLMAQTLYHKFTGVAVSGFTTVIILNLLLSSVIMISLGIIGIYLANIYSEIKSRPSYLVAEEISTRTDNSCNRESSTPN